MMAGSTHSKPFRLALGLQAALGLCLASSAMAQMPTAMLSSVFPPGGQIGVETEVQITGENLDEATTLQFSHPGISASQKMNPPDEFSPSPTPIPNTFLVKVAGDVPAGIYEVRSVGRYGISNPRAFVVDDQRLVLREGVPDAKDKAMPVELGSSVFAQMTSQRIEHYKVELQKGDRVLIDCWGQRIDSRIDPVISLYDPSGRMVRRARQADPRDSLIEWKVATPGPHIVAVHDFTYQGGADFAYRLSLRKAPYIDFIFPPVGKPGSNDQYTLYGRNLPGGQSADLKVRGVPLEKLTVNIALPGDPVSLSKLPMVGAMDSTQAVSTGFAYRLPSPDGLSNAVMIHYADAPITIEQEPANDTQAAPQKVTVPGEYVGQFYPARDRDWVAFDAKKGEAYWINVFSQRLGTFADPVLMIEKVTKNDKGEEQVRQVTRLDDAPYTAPPNNQPDIISLKTDDPKFRLVADEDALYRIRLNDLYNNPANDPRLSYRLVIQKENPDFQLVAYVEPEKTQNNQLKPTACVVRRGGTQAIKLNLNRQYGFEGPVTVRVEGLPQGVTCRGAELAGAVDEGWLVVEAAENAAGWAGAIRIIGKAEMEGKAIEREASYGTLLWPVAQNTQATSRLARNMTLAVITAETAPVVLQAGDGNVIETSLGGKVEIPLKVTKRAEIKGDLKVSAVNLPRDINRSDVNVKDNGKALLDLRTSNIPLGTFTFYFQGTSKFGYKRNEAAIAKAKEEQTRAGELKKKYDEELKAAQAKVAQTTKDGQTAANGLKTAQQAGDAAKKAADDLAKQITAAEQKLAAAKKAAGDAKDDKAKADAAQKAEKELADLKARSAQADAKKAEAENALKIAEEKNQAALKAKQDADAAVKLATDMQKKADAYAKKATADLTSVTNQNKPADINLYVVSSPVVMRVHPHPLKITAPSTLGKLQPGAALELPVSIERLYGFEDKVDLELELPGGIKGLSVDRASIEKGKKDGKLTLKAGKDLTPGVHAAKLKLRLRFNNVSLVAEQPITIEAEPPKEVAGK